jgi:lipoprotein-anchoring transpeptidase ErfK/SrfK
LTDREIWTIAIRIIIAVILILLIGALSCSGVLASKTRKSAQAPSPEQRYEAEQRLSELGYWTGPVDEDFDSATRHALMAFQKVEGRARTGKLTLQELAAIKEASRPSPRQPEFAHVEIDLARQVLFVVDDNGIVTRVLPVSTGNEQLYVDHGQTHRAHTPRGTFKVFRKINGWRLSSLGLLYYPSYIVNGIAIHGSLSIPAYPASHGCIRIPMYAAKEVSALLTVGSTVIIYERRGQLSRADGR